MNYEPRNLKRWTLPDSYFGETWPNYYSSGFGQSRDSDDLEQSNFATALKALGGEFETVQIVRESHWAVGWVEWIAIHQDDDKALAIADDLRDSYENYPVLDEDDLGEREWNHAYEAWEQALLCGRIEICKRFNVSIFAARRVDELPRDDNGAIYDYLRQS